MQPAGCRNRPGSLYQAGGTTALDMMLTMIASQHGQTSAVSCRSYAAFIRHHSEHQHVASCPHRRAPSKAGWHHCKDGGKRKSSATQFAGKQAGLSTRQLERRSGAMLIAPKRYYLEPPEEGPLILLQTDMSVINGARQRFSPIAFFQMLPAYGQTP
jgi:transcriptional regulator GlxA family with amidase domain